MLVEYTRVLRTLSQHHREKERVKRPSTVRHGNSIWIVRRIMNIALICFLACEWMDTQRKTHSTIFDPAFNVRFMEFRNFLGIASIWYEARGRINFSTNQSQILRTGNFVNICLFRQGTEKVLASSNYHGYSIQDERINIDTFGGQFLRVRFCAWELKIEMKFVCRRYPTRPIKDHVTGYPFSRSQPTHHELMSAWHAFKLRAGVKHNFRSPEMK